MIGNLIRNTQTKVQNIQNKGKSLLAAIENSRQALLRDEQQYIEICESGVVGATIETEDDGENLESKLLLSIKERRNEQKRLRSDVDENNKQAEAVALEVDKYLKKQARLKKQSSEIEKSIQAQNAKLLRINQRILKSKQSLTCLENHYTSLNRRDMDCSFEVKKPSSSKVRQLMERVLDLRALVDSQFVIAEQKLKSKFQQLLIQTFNKR